MHDSGKHLNIEGKNQMNTYLMKQFFLIKLAISLSVIFILPGCGGDSAVTPNENSGIILDGTKSIAPRSISIALTTAASKQLNPDLEKRASPIVIRIYLLTHIDTFDNSDFFALYENDKSILEKDLKFREEMEIKPGQSTSKALEVTPDSRYIAVLAAFRDLDNAQWKSFLKINHLNLQSLRIELGESTVNIDPEPLNNSIPEHEPKNTRD